MWGKNQISSIKLSQIMKTTYLKETLRKYIPGKHYRIKYFRPLQIIPAFLKN